MSLAEGTAPATSALSSRARPRAVRRISASPGIAGTRWVGEVKKGPAGWRGITDREWYDRCPDQDLHRYNARRSSAPREALPTAFLKRGCPVGRESGRAPAATRLAWHRGADEGAWPEVYETPVDTMIFAWIRVSGPTWKRVSGPTWKRVSGPTWKSSSYLR